MRRLTVVVAVVLVVGGCSSDDSGGSAADTSADTTAAPTTTASPADDSQAQAIVEELSADGLAGRDNQTPGGEAAADLLVERLDALVEPLPDAPDGFRYDFPAGTNLIGVIPGSELPDEYVLVGAHYDHLGTDSATSVPADHICNGATDNATGVAAVLEIGRRLADDPPRRSVILALWDAEEDDLLGSAAFVADPPVPLDQIVGYVNFDIQGANLLPSVADVSFMIGAETGGPNLVGAATEAAVEGPLNTLPLSLLFGQGRSDHATFAAGGVPIVFFTDANSGCYHTAQDEVGVVDFGKLEAQIGTGERLVQDLATTDDLPEYTPNTPAATFTDAEGILAVVQQAEPDLGLVAPAQRRTIEQFIEDLTAIVDAGEAAFDDDAVTTLLGGSVALVEALRGTTCDGYLS